MIGWCFLKEAFHSAKYLPLFVDAELGILLSLLNKGDPAVPLSLAIVLILAVHLLQLIIIVVNDGLPVNTFVIFALVSLALGMK